MRSNATGDVFPWLVPTASLALSANEVHIWLARLDSSAMHVQQIARCLAEDERSRAERFRFERDKQRFIIGRGALRSILGRYLQIDPGRVRFSYGPNGKPGLEESLGDNALRFNLAHSEGLALYAFTRGREIGVDIEYLRTIPDADEIAKRFFSPNENAELQALPASDREAVFFDFWTRKEAYIKALGVGLSHALDQFDVSLVPAEPARLVDVGMACDDASRWSLKALLPAPDYVAALAVEGHDWHPRFWQFQGSEPEDSQSSESPLLE